MILRRLVARTFAILGTLETWRAMVDDPVLLCACQDGDWCDACEPKQQVRAVLPRACPVLASAV